MESAEAMKIKIERADCSSRRILAVSDIHGNLNLFRRLMEQVNFSGKDELFLLGDLVERGFQNLDTLHFVMELGKRENVHILMGNNDTVWQDILTDGDFQTMRYLRSRKGSVLHEMCRTLSIEIGEDTAFTPLREKLRKEFLPEFLWLHNLPHIIETREFTFVHSGLAVGVLESQKPWEVMKNDGFLMGDSRFEKYVAVGHMPVCNLGWNVGRNNPLTDPVRKVIGIDGGSGLKVGGQLNCLIIEPGPPEGLQERISFASVDEFPSLTVLSSQEESSASVYLSWQDTLEILENRGEFAFCRFQGTELEVPADSLYFREGRVHSEMATNYRLPVRTGDSVSLIRRYSDRSYCKKDGVLGWIANDRLKGF